MSGSFQSFLRGVGACPRLFSLTRQTPGNAADRAAGNESAPRRGLPGGGWTSERSRTRKPLSQGHVARARHQRGGGTMGRGECSVDRHDCRNGGWQRERPARSGGCRAGRRRESRRCHERGRPLRDCRGASRRRRADRAGARLPGAAGSRRASGCRCGGAGNSRADRHTELPGPRAGHRKQGTAQHRRDCGAGGRRRSVDHRRAWRPAPHTGHLSRTGCDREHPGRIVRVRHAARSPAGRQRVHEHASPHRRRAADRFVEQLACHQPAHPRRRQHRGGARTELGALRPDGHRGRGERSHG